MLLEAMLVLLLFKSERVLSLKRRGMLYTKTHVRARNTLARSYSLASDVIGKPRDQKEMTIFFLLENGKRKT